MGANYSINQDGKTYSLFDEIYFSILVNDELWVKLNESQKEEDKFDKIKEAISKKVAILMQETFDKIVGEDKVIIDV